MFAVTVTFAVREEFDDRFAKSVLAQARNSLEREEGCHQFDVCFDPSNKGRIFLYEIYSDEPSFQAHLKTEHFISFDAEVKDWLISKEVQTWERMEQG